jgi:hypothetical protein
MRVSGERAFWKWSKATPWRTSVVRGFSADLLLRSLSD